MADPWRQRVAARAGLAIGILILLLAFLLVWQYTERRTMKVVIAVIPFHADPSQTGPGEETVGHHGRRPVVDQQRRDSEPRHRQRSIGAGDRHAEAV